MKKKVIVVSIAFLALILLSSLWYLSPVSAWSVESAKVKEIRIVDGKTGKEIRIEQREKIDHLIGNLSKLELQRRRISFGEIGYRYRVRIIMNEGERMNGWDRFVIRSEGRISNTPFLYAPYGKGVDMDYIHLLFQEHLNGG